MEEIKISNEDFFWLVISKINKSKKKEEEMILPVLKFLAQRNHEERDLFFEMLEEKIETLDFSQVEGINQNDIPMLKAWVIGIGEYYYHCTIEKPDTVLEGKGKMLVKLRYIKEEFKEYQR